MHLEMSVSKIIGSWASTVFQNYQNFIEMTSNMIYNVALGSGFKFSRSYKESVQIGFSGLLDAQGIKTVHCLRPRSC